MTQEEKQLLLKDLCARLPYGVKITDGLHTVTLKVRIDTASATLAQFMQSEDLTYYLRPMSSMTEEEQKEYCDLQDEFLYSSQYPVTDAYKLFNWLNEHHFDYRGLIEKGLALEAPKDMYKEK